MHRWHILTPASVLLRLPKTTWTWYPATCSGICCFLSCHYLCSPWLGQDWRHGHQLVHLITGKTGRLHDCTHDEAVGVELECWCAGDSLLATQRLMEVAVHGAITVVLVLRFVGCLVEHMKQVLTIVPTIYIRLTITTSYRRWKKYILCTRLTININYRRWTFFRLSAQLTISTIYTAPPPWWPFVQHISPPCRLP